MMKRKNIFRISVALLTATTFFSCSDEFMQEKKNFDSTTADAYNYWSGALARVADVYKTCLPNCASSPSAMYNSTGLSDDQSKSTEEYSGFSVFVDPNNPLTYQTGNNPVPDYFEGTKGDPINSAYGRIRNINDAIAGIEGSTLSQEEKDQLLGQVYFFRAWCYYNLVKWYGGVPIITEVQEPVAESITPRSSAKDCFQFICDDLNKAETLLTPYTGAGQWMSGDNYGRVTSGTAVALLGRVRLLYASPLFNRTNDPDRWKLAYEEIKRSLDVLAAAGYGLANESNPGTNASGWASIFSQVPSTEAVFVTLYNTLVAGTPDYRKNNTWEHGIRPKNALGGGGKTPSAMIVDMFPMADGKVPNTCNTYTKLSRSETLYEPEYPFLNRDPRFYRTFAFPGVRWAFKGDPRIEDKNDNPYNGPSYELWNYVWYTTEEARDDIEANSNSTYGADALLNDVKGFYIRKRTDDLDVNANERYVYETASGFTRSASPYMEIRYAEVLLNYAEAACGAGHMDIAVEQLKKIRGRVGYTGDCGLDDGLEGDQAKCMAAILYERQIELAYEGKRFDDLRRWMLFDGGAELADGAPATWKLTGWGGNTCTYLGFKELNGQRRENLEFRVKIDAGKGAGIGGTTFDSDPLTVAGVTRPAAIDLRNEDIETQLNALKNFYEVNLTRKTKKGDSYDDSHAELYMKFYPHYYLLGFNQGIQGNNATLLQTIGWGDYMNGGANGTFDPLAE